MGRRKTEEFEREVKEDYIYKSKLITKFVNIMMWDGKFSVSEKILYNSLDYINKKTGENGFELFRKAISNIKPQIEVKSKRVGGVTYQVPVEVYPLRQESLAIRWVINSARSRKGKGMYQKLGLELIDAYNNTGGAFRKREEVKKMAEANKAFAHYAW